MRSVMKLSSAEVELTLTQFEAQVIPDDPIRWFRN
jgi:hypothetical protein